MATDDRLSWIDRRLKSSLGCKGTLSSIDPQMLREMFIFFERMDLRTLFAAVNRETQLPMLSLMPVQVPTDQKLLVFRKCFGVSSISESDIAKQLVACELVATPWHHLWLVSRDVYLPLLAACVDYPPVPHLDSTEARRVHDAHLKLLSAMQLTEGHMHGKVMLPMPLLNSPADGKPEGSEPPVNSGRVSVTSGFGKSTTTSSSNGAAKEHIHQLESALVAWSKIIKGVLKMSIGEVLRQVKHPGPLMELEAFELRQKHLNSVHDQLQSVEVQAIMQELEAASSNYVQSLSNLKEEVIQAREQNFKTVSALRACKPYFDALANSSVPIPHAVHKVPALLHSLFLLWRHCDWYRNAKRFQRLLRLVCNQIIQRSQAVITTTPQLNFPDNLQDQLRTVLRLCASFRGTYLDVRDQAQMVARNMVQEQFVDDKHISVAMTTKQEAAMEQTFRSALAAWPERSEGPFKRFNSFIDRCNDVLDLAESVHHFKQLRHLVLGGPHGQRLSAGISQIYEEFEPALRKFESKRLRLVDIDSNVEEFNQEFFELRLTVKNLERILARVLKEAYKYCSSLQQRLSILDMFDSISMREAIVTALEDEHARIISEAIQHFRETLQVLYTPISRFRDEESSMAPPSHASRKASVASLASATDGLSFASTTTTQPEHLTYRRASPFIDEMIQIAVAEQRLKDPWRVIQKLPQACLISKKGHELQQLHAKAIREVASARRSMLKQWYSLAQNTPPDVLSFPLFFREKVTITSEDDGNLASRHRLPVFRINLPGDLMKRIREAQFLQRHNHEVGETMEMLCQRHSSLHVVVARLNMVLNMYNHLRVKLDQFERPLYYDMFPRLVETLTKGTTEFTFNSSSLDDYLSLLEELLIDGFKSRLDTVAQARLEMNRIVERWSSTSLALSAFADTALDQRPLVASEFQAYHVSCMKRLRLTLTQDSGRLRELVDSCLAASYVTESSPAWEAFLEHLDTKVSQGVVDLLSTALRRIHESLNKPTLNEKAVFRVEVSVTNGTVVHNPPLVQSHHAAETTLVEIMEKAIDDILQLSKCVASPRTREPYDLTALDNAQDTVDTIRSAVADSATYCQQQLQVLANYELLYKEDPQILFTMFLQDRGLLMQSSELAVLSRDVTGQPLRLEHLQSRKFGASRFGRMHDLATLSDGDVDKVPTLEEFSSCLQVFKAAQEKLRALPDQRQLGWLQLDLVPINATLRALASRWLYTFGQYILSCAENTIEKLRKYLDWTEDGIVELKTSGSQFSFMKLMNFFHDVSMRQEETDGKLGPLKRTLTLLGQYGLHVPREEEQAYAAFPERMQAMRKKLEDLKRGLAPRISKEAKRIKEQLVQFDNKLRVAFEELLSCDAFFSSTSPETARILIEEQTEEFGKLEMQSRDLSQLQQLTSLSVVDFNLLANAKQTLARVDEVTSLRLHFNEELGDLLATKWAEADLERTKQKAQAVLALVHALPQECFDWDVTMGLEHSAEAIIKSVPLLESLKKEDLRSSHWKKLFRDAGITEALDEATVNSWSLREMLQWLPQDQPSLVETVVELAAKDIRSENALRQYEEKWMTAVFTLKPWYPGLGVNELVVSSLKANKIGVSQRFGRSSRLRADSRDRRASGISSRGSVMSEKSGRPNELTAAMLVSGLEDLFTMLANNRDTIQLLHNEKGYGSRVMASEITATENRLKTIDEVLTTLKQVQELWVVTSEAFAAFMHDSHEGEDHTSALRASLRMHHTSMASLRSALHPSEKKSAFDRDLQREIQMFQSTDHEFRSLLASIQRDPAVVGLCLRPGVLNLLNNIQQNFLHIRGSLQRFFYNHCDMFPRLYFLSPSDVLDVQTCCGHPTLVQRGVNHVFPGVRAVDIEERNQSRIVTGVTATTGEKVEFDISFVFKGPAVIFLDTLASKLKDYVRRQITALLRDDQAEGILSPFELPGQERGHQHPDGDANSSSNDNEQEEDGDSEHSRDKEGTGHPTPLASSRPSRGSHGSLVPPAASTRRRNPSSYSMNWTMDRLAQCAVMGLLIKNTQEIDALVELSNSDKPADSAEVPRLLKELHAARVLQVHEMQNTLASAHSTADRQKMTTLISFLIYLRDVASRINNNPSSLASASTNRRGSLSHSVGPGHTPPTTASSPTRSAEESLALTWEASSAVRCHATAEGDVLVQFGTCASSYSFEVAEPGQAVCLTDLTERYWFGIMRASSLGLGAAVVCETRSNPTHTVTTLSYLLGRPLHTVRCTPLTSFALLAQALRGMATMDSVLVLEGVSKLPGSVLASLTDTVRLVMQAVRSENNDAVRIGRGPAVRVTTQPVCVLAHCNIHHEPLPIGVRQCFRTVATSLPHSAFVAEAILASHGFKHASKLAAALHRFITLMASLAPRPLPNQMPHPLSCTWGLAFTQRVVNFVMASRPEPPAVSGMSEEEEVTCAILSLVGSRVCDATDRELFLAVLRQCFDAAHRVDDATLVMDMSHLPSTHRRFTRPLGQETHNVLERMGLSPQGHLPESVEKLNALLNGHRVAYLVGAPGCGKSACVEGLAGSLRGQGFDVETVSLPCGYLTPEELVGRPMSPDNVHLINNAGDGGSSGGGSGSEGALIPLLLQQMQHALETQAVNDGGSERSRDQQVMRTRWLCLEGPIPDEIRARLVLLEETGVLPLPDGSRVRVHEQLRVLVLTTPDAFDASSEASTVDFCGVLRLENANEVANACKATLHWATQLAERYAPEFRDVVESHLKLFQEFWARFARKLGKQRLTCAMGTLRTATSLFGPCIDACVPDGSRSQTARFLAPCFNFCLMWACLGSLARVLEEHRQVKDGASDWWRRRSKQVTGVVYPDDTEIAVARHARSASFSAVQRQRKQQQQQTQRRGRSQQQQDATGPEEAHGADSHDSGADSDDGGREHGDQRPWRASVEEGLADAAAGKEARREHVLSYRVDPDTGAMAHWSKFLPDFVLPPPRGIDSQPVETAIVPTIRLEAIKFVTQLSLQASRNVLLLGQAAAGKSTLLSDVVEMQARQSASGSEASVVSMQGCERLSPSMIWKNLHKQLESPSGMAYVPAGSRRQLVCVVDDIDTTQPLGCARDGGGGSGSEDSSTYDTATYRDMSLFLAGEQGDAPDVDPLRSKCPQQVSPSGKFLEQLSVHGFTFDQQGRCRQVCGVTCLMSATLDENEEVLNAFVSPSFSRNCTVLVLPLPDAHERTAMYTALLSSHFYTKVQQETRQHKQAAPLKSPLTSNPISYTEWVCPIVRAGVELHDRLRCLYTNTRDRALYRFNERDLKHSLVELANRLEPQSSLELVVFVWSTVLATIYSRRMVSKNDIARFRTLLQNVVRKRFYRDLLPAGPSLPLWVYRHDAFVGQELPVDHEHDECVMLCPRELIQAVVPYKGRPIAQRAGGVAGLRASSERLQEPVQQQYLSQQQEQRRSRQQQSLSHHQRQQGGLQQQQQQQPQFYDEQTKQQQQHSQQQQQQHHFYHLGEGTGAGRRRLLHMSASELFASLKDTLSNFFMDSEGRISTFQLRLPGMFVGTIAEIVEHLRQAKYRTNMLLRMPRVKDIIQLCGSLSGFEVVFAEEMDDHARVRSQFVDLVMRAGTRDEKIVYAISVSECPMELLAMLSSFVTSAEIGDLLSPDNLVAVSTLSQPKVIQAGLQPSLKNSWAFFKRTIRQNLRLIFYVPERGPTSAFHQLRLVAFSQRLASNLLVFAQPQAVEHDLAGLASESLLTSFKKLRGLYDEAVVPRLTPLMTTMHTIVTNYESKRLNDQLALAHVTTSHFDTFVSEAAAMLKMQWQYISEEAVSREQGLAHTRNAQEHVQRLKTRHDELLNVWKEKDAITTRLLTQIGRDLASLKRLQARQETQDHDLNELKSQLPAFKQKYDAAMAITSQRLKVMKRQVAKLNDGNIRVLQLMTRVSDNIELVFASILILLNNYSPEDVAELDLSWRAAGRRLCSDVNRLRQNLLDVHSAELDTASLNEINVLFESSDLELPPPTSLGDSSDNNMGEQGAGSEQGATGGDATGEHGDGEGSEGGDKPEGDDDDDDDDNNGNNRSSKAQQDVAEGNADPTERQGEKEDSRRSSGAGSGNKGNAGEGHNQGFPETAERGRSSESVGSHSPRGLSPDVLRRVRRGSISPRALHRMSIFREESEETEAYKILLQWLSDALALHQHLNQVARPLEREYNDFLGELDKRQATLEGMQQSCAAISERINTLQTSFDTSTRVKNDQRRALASIAEELRQAQAFLETLHDEQASWHESLAELQEEALYIEANALMSAAIRTYLPALSNETRVQMISLWVESVLDKGLHIASEVKVSRRLSKMRRVSTPNFEQSLLRAASARSVPEAEDETQILDLDTILPQLCGKAAVIQGAQQGDNEFFFINRSVLAWPKSWNLVLDPHGFGAEHIVRIETGDVAMLGVNGDRPDNAAGGSKSHTNRNSRNGDNGGGLPPYSTSGASSTQGAGIGGGPGSLGSSFGGPHSSMPASMAGSDTQGSSATRAGASGLDGQSRLVIVDMKFGSVEWAKLQLQLEDAFASQLPILLLNAPEQLDDNLHHYLLSAWQRLSTAVARNAGPLQAAADDDATDAGQQQQTGQQGGSSRPQQPQEKQEQAQAQAGDEQGTGTGTAAAAQQPEQSESGQGAQQAQEGGAAVAVKPGPADATSELSDATTSSTSTSTHPSAATTAPDAHFGSGSGSEGSDKSLRFDVTGQVMPDVLPIRVYICGPRLNLDSWLGNGQSYLSLVSYADVDLPSMQQFVGAMLYQLFWSEENTQYNELMLQASRLEEGVVTARRQVVDALRASSGLPDASGIAELVHAKQNMELQLNETHEVIQELELSKDRCEVVSSYCCRLVQLALSFNCLSPNYGFSAGMVARAFVHGLKNQESVPARSGGSTDWSQELPAVSDHELPVSAGLLRAARQVRNALLDEHVTAFDVLFYFYLVVPMLTDQRDFQEADELESSQETSGPSSSSTNQEKEEEEEEEEGGGEHGQPRRHHQNAVQQLLLIEEEQEESEGGTGRFQDSLEPLRDVSGDSGAGRASRRNSMRGRGARRGSLRRSRDGVQLPGPGPFIPTEDELQHLTSLLVEFVGPDTDAANLKPHTTTPNPDDDAPRPVDWIQQDQWRELHRVDALATRARNLRDICSTVCHSTDWEEWCARVRASFDDMPQAFAADMDRHDADVLEFYRLLVLGAMRPDLFLTQLHAYALSRLSHEALGIDVPTPLLNRRKVKAAVTEPWLPGHRQMCHVSELHACPPSPVLVLLDTVMQPTALFVDVLQQLVTEGQASPQPANGDGDGDGGNGGGGKQEASITRVCFGCLTEDHLRTVLDKALMSHTWVVCERIDLQPALFPLLLSYALRSDEAGYEGMSQADAALAQSPGRVLLLCDKNARLPPALVQSCVTLTLFKERSILEHFQRTTFTYQREVEAAQDASTRLVLFTVALCHAALVTREAQQGWFVPTPLSDTDLICCTSRLLEFVRSPPAAKLATPRDVQQQLVQIALAEYSLAISSEWDQRLLETLMGVFLGGDISATLKGLAIVGEDFSLDDGSRALGAWQEAAAALDSRLSGDAEALLQDKTLASMWHHRQQEATHMRAVAKTAQRLESGSALNPRRLESHTTDRCMEALEYVQRHVRQLQEALPRRRLKQLSGTAFSKRFPAVFALARKAITAMYDQLERMSWHAATVSQILSSPCLPQSTLAVTVTAASKNRVPPMWDLHAYREEASLYEYVQTACSRLATMIVCLEQDTAIPKMDARLTAFPQSLFAALSIDTSAHLTQIISKDVSCPGHVIAQFPLSGLELDAASVMGEGQVLKAAGKSEEPGITVELVVRCVADPSRRIPPTLRVVEEEEEDDDEEGHVNGNDASNTDTASAERAEGGVEPSISALSFASDAGLNMVWDAQPAGALDASAPSIPSPYTLAIPILCESGRHRIPVSAAHVVCDHDDEVALVLANASLEVSTEE